MELTYNGLTNNNGIVTFSGVPNILQFTGSSTENIKAKYQITIGSLSDVDPDKTYTISLGESKITSVNEYSQQGGMNFYLPPIDTYDNRLACCNSITKALRNVPDIAANYSVWLSDDNDGTMDSSVYIEAKSVGSEYNLTPYTDLTEAGNNTFVQTVQGSSDDDMLQGSDNKLTVDVYKYTVQTRIGATPLPANREYVTTLEKNYTRGSVYFNMTPVLSSMTDEGETQQYCFTVYGFSDGSLKFSHMTEPAYITQGYQANQSEPFISSFVNRFFAQNVSRGEEREQYNKTPLYIYDNVLSFSLYVKSGITTTTATVNYTGSDGTVLYTNSFSLDTADTTRTLFDFDIILDRTKLTESTYIDLILPDIGTVRYDVIKPVNAADNKDFERIFWRNEYGGISFIDLTGERTETRKENIEYYQKQTFDFYESETRELTKVYSKSIPVTVKHTSHNIDENAKYLFFSLQNSSKAWTTINGVQYAIHISDLEIKETSVKHILKATVQYDISFPDLP